MRRFLAACVVVCTAAILSHVLPARSQGEAVRKFSIANIEYKGTKVWVPGTLIAKMGEKVEIKLVNSAPSGKHGFAIDAFGVKVEVAGDGKPVIVEFKADKPGLHTIHCQLHPAHIGGQLLVLDR